MKNEIKNNYYSASLDVIFNSFLTMCKISAGRRNRTLFCDFSVINFNIIYLFFKKR